MRTQKRQTSKPKEHNLAPVINLYAVRGGLPADHPSVLELHRKLMHLLTHNLKELYLSFGLVHNEAKIACYDQGKSYLWPQFKMHEDIFRDIEALYKAKEPKQ